MADNKVKVFFENFRIRFKPKPKSGIIDVDFENNIGDFLEGLEGSNILDMSELNIFRTMSIDRETQYRLYDEMAVDSVLSSALELYADDATQYNLKGDIIWAEAENSDVAAYANRLIDALGINSKAWSHIYSMIKYGDLYIETFKDDEIDDDPLITNKLPYTDIQVSRNKVGAKLEEYVEVFPNPSIIFDLSKKGKTVGFIKIEQMDANPLDPRYNYQHIQEGQSENILPPDKYVHISLSNKTDRFPETVSITFSTDESESKTKTYRISRGKSILHDAYRIYRELKLMEDSLLLNRVTRSSIIRLLQVEIGDMPKTQARNLLKRIKTMVEQKNFMDKSDETYTSMASPGPIDNIIYNPTRDGKGAISIANIGGDPDVKSISDIDYFKTKLYAVLKIPPQFLGDTSDPAGFSGGTSLTKLDSRYARTIKRIQSTYIAGITTLINLFALSDGLEDHVNNFVIKMVSPSTIEDSERDELLNERISMIKDLVDLFNDPEIVSTKARKSILIHLIGTFINEPEIVEILEQDIIVEEEPEEIEEDFNENVTSSNSFKSPSSSKLNDTDNFEEPLDSLNEQPIEDENFSEIINDEDRYNDFDNEIGIIDEV